MVFFFLATVSVDDLFGFILKPFINRSFIIIQTEINDINVEKQLS